MLAIGASYLFVPLAIVPTALRQRAMDFRSDFMIEVGASITNAAVTLTLAAMGQGAMALACGALAQQIARALVSQWRSGWTFPWPLRCAGASHVIRFRSEARRVGIECVRTCRAGGRRGTLKKQQ